MADESSPEPQPTASDVQIPDYRVVSVVHDADNDRMSVIYDDDLDPHHALGLLVHGLWQQLTDLEMGEIDDLDESTEDED
jgi:hypothetical protein